jgi:hypothetical protein
VTGVRRTLFRIVLGERGNGNYGDGVDRANVEETYFGIG